MTVPPGRRERKKAATRQKIADAALRLFLERGYDAVGIRDVAAEADVAVTTLFSHFASKEALVFEQDQDFEQRLTAAVTGRAPHEPLLPALRREIHALVRHCTADGTAPIWHMIDASPALREYEESMRLRHAESLATAIAADPGRSQTTTACRTIARFVIDAYALAREAADPEAAVDEVFRMIEAAWEVASPSRRT
ncbi:TetR/AcrR family transcriptional regulator [Streptomyces rapamycinicus]|uniref:TetR family transcriptional regulator n=2 Tax=Streptomyces rapamycinicus TaxID=1226757 RepID=A0A0A0N980_STRRN|nr:TetR/AcrR family transcriptional regulator [Streptomyces rapamycinicus]AGP53761.1 TetR family transcriptional regulator [Streptomyces rapamycinicus NRRL 5491]MBB4781250.1 AcrR family transcriptional regulator [Streptomyces rapamycinicus]RLV74106.1 TetR family transcriptional regulator [Streptomyces rapamycinicus NRRL 5491]UTO61885.1 TetR/AcrR family transcriptional regulator [Streptomyces rapamycinicus]UTP29837.1 TetR/AcrR family transcriptional regulator [Streptomyces rapamycinicus NRRL 54